MLWIQSLGKIIFRRNSGGRLLLLEALGQMPVTAHVSSMASDTMGANISASQISPRK